MPKSKLHNKFSKSKILKRRSLAIFILAFAAIGFITLLATRAANPTASIEPESGSISRPAIACTDTNASKGSCVQFKSNPTGYARPFSSTVAWNIPVAGLPTSPNSALYVAHLWDGSPHPGELHMYSDGYTYPVYDASTATETVPINVTVPSYGSNLIGKTMPWNPAWQPAAGTDAQMIVVDPATGREWDLWMTSYNSTAKTLSIGNGNLVAGDYRTGTGVSNGSRGCGLAYLAMLVRPQEVAQGRITHALSMPMGTVSSTFVSPATKSDAGGGVIPMGTRFAIHVTDAQIDSWASSLSLSATGQQSAKVIARALRDYGMFVTDNGGQATVQLEDVHSAGAQWQALGFGPPSNLGNTTNQMLDTLVNSSNLYAIAPGN